VPFHDRNPPGFNATGGTLAGWSSRSVGGGVMVGGRVAVAVGTGVGGTVEVAVAVGGTVAVTTVVGVGTLWEDAAQAVSKSAHNASVNRLGVGMAGNGNANRRARQTPPAGPNLQS
jgi:hypothetical protein